MLESVQNPIFVSYASQDNEAARRICVALRVAGLDVWFDQSELRGGDAWDASIRKQIKECALFVPLISATTNARSEGYFRLEWRLADQRTHLMGRKAFVVPVCIDNTSDVGADVPDSFLGVQWTRLPNGEVSAAFVERVKQLLAPQPTAVVLAQTVEVGASIPNAGAAKNPIIKNRKSVIIVSAASVTALIGLVGWYSTFNAVKTPSQPSTLGATGDVDSIYPLSIMVLPFANQTGDVAKGYVADALTSNITSDLSRIRDTMVMAPAQAYAYRDKAVSLQQIGREAGVRFILQGALQASAEKVRVAVQLADASNGTLLWNETIEGDMVDLFALQDKVTQRVSVSIGPAMIVSSARTSETRKGNLRAVDAVLRAKALELQPVSMENYKKMQDFYRQALKLEPENVVAQYGLAVALDRWRGNFISKLNAEQLFTAEREIQALTASVVQSEPDSPRSRSLLARVADMKGDCMAVMDAAVARVAAEPTNASALFGLGHAKAVMGLPREGIPAYERALELSPKFGASHVYYGLGTAYVMLGEPDAAIPWLLKATQMEPNFFDLNAWLAIAYELKGDKEQVKAQMARLKILAPDFRAKDMDKPGSACTPTVIDFWNQHVGALAARVGIPP